MLNHLAKLPKRNRNRDLRIERKSRLRRRLTRGMEPLENRRLLAATLDTNPDLLGHAGADSDYSNQYGKDLEVAENGDAMALWLESEGDGDNGPWRAVAAEYDAAGGAWATPVTINQAEETVKTKGNSGKTETRTTNVTNWARMAGDGQGNYLAVWQQPSAGYESIWANQYVAGSGWQSPSLLETDDSADAYDPEVAIAYDPGAGVTRGVVGWSGSDGNVMINRLSDFAASSWSGAESAEAISVDIHAQNLGIDMAADGDFGLVMRTTHDAGSDAYFRHYDHSASGWSGPADLVESRAESVLYTAIEMNSDGEAMVAWEQQTGNSGADQFWARRWNGTSWDDSPQVVSDDPDNSIGNIQIAISDNGTAMAVYRQYRGGSTYIDAFARQHDGASWATTSDGSADIVQLDTEDLGHVGAGPQNNAFVGNMDVALDGNGRGVAVWTQDDGSSINIWSATYNGTDWQSPTKLDSESADAVQTTAALNGAGDGHVTWVQSDGSLNHVYTSPVSTPAALAHDVAVTGLSAPSAVVQGDSESVDVGVENQGSNDETFDVTLVSDNGTPTDSTDDFTIDSWTGVALVSGSSTTLTAVWDTTDVDLADHTLTVEAILSTDEDAADNTKSATVSVEAERHDVAVTQLTAPSPVVEGDVASIDTTVENQGNRGETFDVTLVSDNGTPFDTFDDIAIATWSSVTLDAGEAQVLTTSWDTSGVNTADHTLTATATAVTDETDTGDNTLAATVTVDPAPAGSTSDMYVSDIRFEQQARGKKHTDYRVVVEIRHDSDADGVGETSDDALEGVQITVNFDGKTYTGKTDANGVFRTEWVKHLDRGNHQAEVTDLALTDFVWNPLLDLEDDSDGDGLPDEWLTI